MSALIWSAVATLQSLVLSVGESPARSAPRKPWAGILPSRWEPVEESRASSLPPGYRTTRWAVLSPLGLSMAALAGRVQKVLSGLEGSEALRPADRRVRISRRTSPRKFPWEQVQGGTGADESAGTSKGSARGGGP